ncbi:hypothetical protein [Paracoccus sp. SY]|uniref:hypothetical protein n=1 Tax=Paracoccus sp. SY TaxID=1330255 RepID=UPI0011AEF15D|nr:hypothetical protein [Paracoccus sp. SY]
MHVGIEDLDELILKCRDRKARDYIREAVGSYRAGSYRSAIVATWIAVCFDLIGKLRELALAGDKEAENQVHELDEITRIEDFQRALKFERGIVDLAFKMEMISPLEQVDLIRLQEDRNRCAHPSLNLDGERYAPPAELARLHINSAVNHLLMHEPAQGKFALDRLCSLIRSQYFPVNDAEALKFLQNGPLRRARPSLPRNLTIILLKGIFDKSEDYMHSTRTVCALNAIHVMHNAQYSDAMREYISKQFEKLDDTKLNLSLDILHKLKDAWLHLDYNQKYRLTKYVQSIPQKDLDELDSALRFPPLREAALRRLRGVTLADFDKVFFWFLNDDIMDKLIDIYLSSPTFEAANQAAKLLTMYKGDIENKHVIKIIEGASKNSQVSGSYELDNLIKTLRDTKKVPPEDFEELLEINGLGKYQEELPF